MQGELDIRTLTLILVLQSEVIHNFKAEILVLIIDMKFPTSPSLLSTLKINLPFSTNKPA